ncbi:MAG: hypothetical protein ACYDH6_14850 [Acidimicrobiales bacterium]
MARMTQQRLALGDDWRLDDQTREIGRRGLAEARAALEAAARRAEAREAHERSAQPQAA